MSPPPPRPPPSSGAALVIKISWWKFPVNSKNIQKLNEFHKNQNCDFSPILKSPKIAKFRAFFIGSNADYRDTLVEMSSEQSTLQNPNAISQNFKIVIFRLFVEISRNHKISRFFHWKVKQISWWKWPVKTKNPNEIS